MGLVLLASCLIAMGGTLSRSILPIRGTLIALTFGALLVTSLGARTESALSRVLCSRVLCFLGTRSYGLYVFHGIIAYWMGEHQAILNALTGRLGAGAGIVAQGGLGAGVSIVVAAASYELFEKHFLRLKNRLAPPVRSAAALPSLHPRPAE
jgi:peptidoglycan/LPS O-acetylase OafA/YrhL